MYRAFHTILLKSIFAFLLYQLFVAFFWQCILTKSSYKNIRLKSFLIFPLGSQKSSSISWFFFGKTASHATGGTFSEINCIKKTNKLTSYTICQYWLKNIKVFLKPGWGLICMVIHYTYIQLVPRAEYTGNGSKGPSGTPLLHLHTRV